MVRIGLHDGSSVRYGTWDETKAGELLEVLRRGVAEAGTQNRIGVRWCRSASSASDTHHSEALGQAALTKSVSGNAPSGNPSGYRVCVWQRLYPGHRRIF